MTYTLVIVGEEGNDVSETVVSCFCPPFPRLILKVQFLIDQEEPLHHQLQLIGRDPVDAGELFYVLADGRELRRKVLLSVEGDGRITKGLEMLGVKDEFRFGIGDNEREERAGFDFVVVELVVFELDDQLVRDVVDMAWRRPRRAPSWV